MPRIEHDVIEAISTGTALAFPVVPIGPAIQKPADLISKSPFPPILLALHQLLEDTQDFETVRDFEQTTLALREIAFRESSSDISECLPCCRAETISSAAANVVDLYLRQSGRHEFKIHLEGIHIQGDLDLSGLDLTGSVRLVACYIEGALILDRTRLVTLDLSGSIIKDGVSATHLETNGSVRCRRMVSMGIMDFGGCRIDGPLDMSDAIIIPFHPPPITSPWVADRSILNLSLGKIGKEARFSRSRVHGGINMRGLKIDGSLFMNDIIARSPLATIEKLILDTRDTPVRDRIKCFHESANSAELDLAHLTIGGTDIHSFAPEERIKFEVLDFLVPPGFSRASGRISVFDQKEFSRFCLLYRLLFELVPVQTYAIRADGVTIVGSFFGRRMRIGGRMKFRRSTIGGRVSFNGSHFRTVRTMYELCRELSDQQTNYPEAPSIRMAAMFSRQIGEDRFIESKARREYAIDFRDSDIGESFEITKDTKQSSPRKNERLLVDVIARKLLQTPDDPRTFLQVFFGKAGLIEDYIKKSYSSGTASANTAPSLQSYQQVARAAHYACSYVYYERMARHAKCIKSAGQKPVWEQLPSEIVGAKYPRAGIPTRACETKSSGENSLGNTKVVADFENALVISACELLVILQSPNRMDPWEAWAVNILLQRIEELWEVYSDEVVAEAGSHLTASQRQSEILHRTKKLLLAVEIFRGTRTIFNRDVSSRINNPLLMGEIAFSNARIGSSLNLMGLIANMFDDDTTLSGAKVRDELQKQYRPAIVLYNANVKGDLDLRDTVGIRSIDAVQVRIDGSLKMSETPDFQLKKDKYGNVFRRALFNAVPVQRDPDDKRSLPKFDFEAAIVAGNATFVFDFDFGPSVNLMFSKIGGRLSILPSRGHIEFASGDNIVRQLPDICDIEEERALALRKASYKLGTIWAHISFAMNRRFRAKKGASRPEWAMTPQRAVKILVPHQDLRGAQCEMFEHPLTAWPKQDALHIEGFRYETTHNSGPLLAKRRTWRLAERQLRENFARYLLIVLTVLAIFIFIYFAVGWQIKSSYNFESRVNIWQAVGKTLGNLEFLAVLGLFAHIAILVLAAKFTHPKEDEFKPRALAYLKLQRRQFNLRRVSKVIQSYDPYVHAAKTLRSSGHMASAADIEYERLKLREHALSWRSTPFQKLALKLVDITVGYGFRPGHLIATSLLVWLGGSLFINAHALKGYMCDARDGGIEGVIVEFLSNSNCRKLNANQTAEFNAHLFTLDVMVPFLTLGQEDKWQFYSPEDDAQSIEGETTNKKSSSQEKIVQLAWLFIPLMKVFGWLVSVVIAISVVSKAETIIARNEDG